MSEYKEALKVKDKQKGPQTQTGQKSQNLCPVDVYLPIIQVSEAMCKVHQLACIPTLLSQIFMRIGVSANDM